MAKKFRDLAESAVSPDAKARAAARTKAMLASMHRRYIEAMGGELDIVARFPDGSIRISQFHDLEPSDTCTYGAEPLALRLTP